MENIGKTFGRLTIKDYFVKNRRQYYLCECSCGIIKEIRKDSVVKDKRATRSCGCIKKEQDLKNLFVEKTHGMTKHRLYKIFNGIKTRCTNDKNNRFSRYGGRGISICKEWTDDYINFHNWAMSNGYKEGLSIERINNDGNYEPNNCEWIEFKEQCKNRKNTIRVLYKDKIYCLMDFSKIVNIPYSTLKNRTKKLIPYEKNMFKSEEIIAR